MTYENGPAIASDLLAVDAEVTSVLGPSGRVVSLLADGDGYGRVLAEETDDAPTCPERFVTWRWATRRTDGSPVETTSGAMLYSGHYDLTREEAEADLVERRPTR